MSLSLRIPRELVSPNKWNGRHWRVKHRISQDWEKDIYHLTLSSLGARTLTDCLAFELLRKGERQPTRKRVTFTRETPSGRNFIRDDDNLRFSCKPALDALKRIGLIWNDSRKWIELPTPEQRISADGKHWTVIEIDQI